MEKIIDFCRIRGEMLMSKGEILFNISSLKVGERLKFYSETKDVFNNCNVDAYTISKDIDGVYIEYSRATGFDDEEKIEFKERVRSIGTNPYEDSLAAMKLTNSEINSLKYNEGNGLIKRGCNLIGVYDNGLEFDFENIIMVNQ